MGFVAGCLSSAVTARRPLMCQAREHKCWNGVTVDGPLAAAKISEAVFGAIKTLKDFDPAFSDILNEEVRRANDSSDEMLQRINVDLERIERELANLMRFLRDGDHSEVVRAELKRLEEERSRLQLVKADADAPASMKLCFRPPTN